MRFERASIATLVVANLSIALGGCSSSDTGAAGTGGASGVAAAAGGAQPSGTGGITNNNGGTQSNAGGTPNAGGASKGGAPSNGGAPGSGGATLGAGGVAMGGTSNSGGSSTTGGKANAGGTGGITTTGGRASETGGAAAGGYIASGGSAAGGVATSGGVTATGGSTSTATCTASKATGANVSGSGPHKVTVETNSGSGINEGTIYRPSDLGGTEKYPILVWGEGGCSRDGSSNATSMAEIASHGYVVVADGTPGATTSRTMDSANVVGMGKPLLAYITWAVAENEKPCSAYYHSLDTTKIAANGFSCGGLMAEGTAGDPRLTTWGITSSGLFSVNQALYQSIHTPVLIILGGQSDMAYPNGTRDYDNISALGVPILYFSKDIGHGGDLWANRGGDFTKIHLAWLNWQLKGDVSATGKGLLVGSGCSYCTNSAWEVKSKNIQ